MANNKKKCFQDLITRLTSNARTKNLNAILGLQEEVIGSGSDR